MIIQGKPPIARKPILLGDPVSFIKEKKVKKSVDLGEAVFFAKILNIQFQNFNKVVLGEKFQLGKYEFDDLLGEGTFGRVYKGLSRLTGDICAGKFIDASKLTHDEFKNEIQSLKSISKINSPFLIRFFDIYYSTSFESQNNTLTPTLTTNLSENSQEKKEIALIFEYCDGDLYSIIHERKNKFTKKRSFLTENEIFDIFSQIVEGLKLLSVSHITHRDLKPENIMYSTQAIGNETVDIIKLIDFGSSTSQKTMRGVAGTNIYKAPELFLSEVGENKDGYTKKVDMWSLGIILHEMLYTKRIFTESNPPNDESDYKKNIRYFEYLQYRLPKLTKFSSPILKKAYEIMEQEFKNGFTIDQFMNKMENDTHLKNTILCKLQKYVTLLLAKDPKKRLSIKKLHEDIKSCNFFDSIAKKILAFDNEKAKLQRKSSNDEVSEMLGSSPTAFNEKDVAQIAKNANEYFIEGYYNKAIEIYKKCLLMLSKTAAKNYKKYSEILGNIGNSYYYIEEYDSALEYFIQTYEWKLKVYGSNHLQTALALNNLGTVHEKLNNYTKALECFEKVLQIYNIIYDECSPNIVKIINNIGSVYSNLNQHEKALGFYFKALKIGKKCYGEYHLCTSSCLNNIGVVYINLQDYEKALEYYEQALLIRKKYFGSKHLQTAIIINNIGLVYSHLNKKKLALDMQLECLDIFEKTYGEDHTKSLGCMNNVAYLYRELGMDERSLEFQERLIKIKIKSCGEFHPSMKTNYRSMSEIYLKLGNYKMAEFFKDKENYIYNLN